jgi:chromosome segregation ATPase
VILTKQREFGYLNKIKSTEIREAQIREEWKRLETESDAQKRKLDNCKVELSILQEKIKYSQQMYAEKDNKIEFLDQEEKKKSEELALLETELCKKVEEIKDLSSRLQRSQAEASRLQMRVVYY